MANWQEIFESNLGHTIVINLDALQAIIPREAQLDHGPIQPSLRFISLDGRIFDWHFLDESLRNHVHENLRVSLIPRQRLTQVLDHELKKRDIE